MSIKKTIIPLAAAAALGAAGLNAQEPITRTTKPTTEVTFTKDQIHKVIWELTSKNLEVPVRKIKATDDFKDKLGGHSIQIVSLVNDIEEHFGIILYNEMLEKVTTVGQLEELVGKVMLTK